MAKPKRPSLADLMQQEAPVVVPPASAPAEVIPLIPSAPPSAVAAEKVRVRRDKPHTTVYIEPAVRLAIKRIALEYNKKPHDLMLEGIDLMLLKYIGKSIKDIT